MIIDNYVKNLSILFEEYGAPEKNREKYEGYPFKTICSLYSAYCSGILRQTIALGLFPNVKV